MSIDHLNVSEPIVLRMGAALSRLSDEEFFEFCQLNRDLRIERTRDGDLIIMPPTGGTTGRRNAYVTARLVVWSETVGSGLVFDSSTGFRLPNGAKRSPDGAWVSDARWASLTEKQQAKFPPLAPDFVVEIRSSSDALDELRDKMREYVENGVRLGWLIDPSSRTVWVYEPGSEARELSDPETLSGDSVLPGFTLGLDAVWR